MIDRMKKLTPRKTATPVIRWMKCSISLAMGVYQEEKKSWKDFQFNWEVSGTTKTSILFLSSQNSWYQWRLLDKNNMAAQCL